MLRDSSLTTQTLLVAGWRATSPARKLHLMHDANVSGRRLALAGLRQRHPAATTDQLRSALAALLHPDVALPAHDTPTSPMENESLYVIALVARTLERLAVTYAIAGSVAGSVHGVPRMTLDVDIVADLSDAQAGALADALDGAFYLDRPAILRAVTQHGSFNLIHLDSLFKVDIFVSGAQPFDQMQLERRIAVTLWEGDAGQLWLVSAEDLILSKLLWYRAGGEQSERQWRDVLNVLQVQAATLDDSYLRAWAAPLGVDDLLAQATAQALNIDSEE